MPTTFDALVAQNDARVRVDCGGVAVYLRPVTAAEDQDLGKVAGNRQLRAMVALTATDEHGAPVFDPDDLDAFDRLPVAVFRRISDATLSLNGYRESVEDAAGNSPTADAGGASDASASS